MNEESDGKRKLRVDKRELEKSAKKKNCEVLMKEGSLRYFLKRQ